MMYSRVVQFNVLIVCYAGGIVVHCAKKLFFMPTAKNIYYFLHCWNVYVRLNIVDVCAVFVIFI